MKIAVLADFHLGFSIRPELENDPFLNAKEAIEKALDCDLILIAGDIFDTRSPKPKVWYNALRLLSLPLKKPSNVKLVKCTKELPEIVKRRTLSHLPVVAIHGNHERVPKGEVNPLKILEGAGLLIYLHTDTIIFEKNGVKVAIHAMSHVPERFAYDFLKNWNPKPLEDCINLLLLHQSIEPYVYSPIEMPTLNVSNLPKDFDLIVNGHIHIHAVEKLGKTTLVIPGSTVITQFQPSESQVKKGFVKIFIEDSKIRIKFVELENQREFCYKELRLPKTNAKNYVEGEIEKLIKRSKGKPVLKLKIIGEYTDITDRDIRDLEKKFKEKCIILFSKELISPEIKEKIEILRSLREEKKSIREMGMSLLKETLKVLGFGWSFDFETILHLLEEKEVEKAMELLLGEQKTLLGWFK